MSSNGLYWALVRPLIWDLMVGVPEGQTSLAIEVVLQPREKTFTDEEIDAVAAKVIAKVTGATGGTLRG